MSVATKRLPLFIEKLGNLSDLGAIKKACESERRALRTHYKNDHTFKSVISLFRNGIREGLPTKCDDILRHFTVGKNISKRMNRASQLKVSLRKYQLIEMPKKDVIDAIEKAKEVLNPNTTSRFGKTVKRSYIEIALGLCLLTGRRPSEIFTGTFEAISDNEVLFSGQLKVKGSDNARHEYIIPVLCNSSLIVESIGVLRERVDFSAETYKDTVKINRNIASNMSIKVGRIFRNIKGNIKASDLRKLYASICHNIFCTSKKYDIDSYYALILGHSISDTTTANSYKMFSVNELDVSNVYNKSTVITTSHLNDMSKIQSEIKGMIDRI